MAGQGDSSNSGDSNQQQTVDEDSGKTETKMLKTSCDENSHDTEPTPQAAMGSGDDIGNETADKDSDTSETNTPETSFEEENGNVASTSQAGAPRERVVVSESGDHAETLVDEKEQQPSHERDGKGKDEEAVPLVVTYNKQRYNVKMALSAKMAAFKDEIYTLTGVHPAMQRLIYKGAPKACDSNKSLLESNVTADAKLMLVGSTLADVLKVQVPVPAEASKAKKEPYCKRKEHLKVLEGGVPENAMLGIMNVRERLPTTPLTGILNKAGRKVRLTFKLEQDELWISTNENTKKIAMNTVVQVVSQPIEGHEEYHITGLQLGRNKCSRYWLYWVPAQYVHAIKKTILGR